MLEWGVEGAQTRLLSCGGGLEEQQVQMYCTEVSNKLFNSQNHGYAKVGIWGGRPFLDQEKPWLFY